jgi:uncharacterized protein (UPF0248 family)
MVECFIAYNDDGGKMVVGFFNVIKLTKSYVFFESNVNIVLIPMHRILKIRMRDAMTYNDLLVEQFKLNQEVKNE